MTSSRYRNPKQRHGTSTSKAARAARSTYHSRKVIACPFCPRAFSCDFNRDQHVRGSHTGEKPFKCHCGKSYGRRWLMLRHQRMVHGGAEQAARRLSDAPAEHSNARFEDESEAGSMLSDYNSLAADERLDENEIRECDEDQSPVPPIALIAPGHPVMIDLTSEPDPPPASPSRVFAVAPAADEPRIAPMSEVAALIHEMLDWSEAEKEQLIAEIQQQRDDGPVYTHFISASEVVRKARPRIFVCPPCDEIFEKLEQIVIHRHIHHGDEVSITCLCRYCKHELGIPDGPPV